MSVNMIQWLEIFHTSVAISVFYNLLQSFTDIKPAFQFLVLIPSVKHTLLVPYSNT